MRVEKSWQNVLIEFKNIKKGSNIVKLTAVACENLFVINNVSFIVTFPFTKNPFYKEGLYISVPLIFYSISDLFWLYDAGTRKEVM